MPCIRPLYLFSINLHSLFLSIFLPFLCSLFCSINVVFFVSFLLFSFFLFIILLSFYPLLFCFLFLPFYRPFPIFFFPFLAFISERTDVVGHKPACSSLTFSFDLYCHHYFATIILTNNDFRQ